MAEFNAQVERLADRVPEIRKFIIPVYPFPDVMTATKFLNDFLTWASNHSTLMIRNMQIIYEFLYMSSETIREKKLTFTFQNIKVVSDSIPVPYKELPRKIQT